MRVVWRIYFADGSTFDSADGAPWEAPKRGVAVILVRDGRFDRRILKMSNAYIWSPTVDRWLDQETAMDAYVRVIKEPWCVVLNGEYQRESEFEDILIRATNDPDFKPRKDAPPPHPAWRD